MKKNRLLWRIYIYFLFATVAALALVIWNAVRTLREYHEKQVAEELVVYAEIAEKEISPFLLDHNADNGGDCCREIAKITGARITVILPGGVVLSDSDDDPARMDNHAGRPEVAASLMGDRGTSTRYSDTRKCWLTYVAIPVWRSGEIVAVVRASQPLSEIREAQKMISLQGLKGGGLAVLLFAVIALYLSRRITRPLEEMRRVAGRLADGDLAARVNVSSHDKIGDLGRTLNQTAVQLSDRMETITRQQIELSAVLSCMVVILGMILKVSKRDPSKRGQLYT